MKGAGAKAFSLIALALALGLSACGGFKARPPGRPGPAVDLPRPAPAIPSDANFVLSVSEAVAGPEEDIPAYLKVTVDGNRAGETPSGPKSQEKKWGARLPPGNHLFGFEYWVASSSGAWTMLDSQWQPVERFIRIEGETRTSVSLKFYEGARRHDARISRQAATPGPQ